MSDLCVRAGFRPSTDVTGYFDWASGSPLSAASVSAMDAFAADAARHPVPPDFLTERTGELGALRDAVRWAVGAPPGSAVALVRSVAEAVSALARVLPLPQGSQIVVSATDHPALVLPWVWLTSVRADLTVRTIRAHASGLVDLEHAATLIDARTAVVAVSHVTHLDGLVQPVAELSGLTRRQGGPATVLLVDGAQSVGRIPVDMEALGADILVGSGRKALMGPLGAGFLVARPGMLDGLAPFVISTRNAGAVLDGSGDWRLLSTRPSGAAAFEGNLPDLRVLCGFAASLRAYVDSAPAELAQRCQELGWAAVDLVQESRLCVVGPTPGRPVGIVRIRSAEVSDHRALKPFLAAEGFALAAARDWLRVSVHAFNSMEGIGALVKRTDALAHELRA